MSKIAVLIYKGLHPFGDERIVDEFYEEDFVIDVTEWNIYKLEWKKDRVEFYYNSKLVRTIEQSPNYPMQFHSRCRWNYRKRSRGS